MVTVKLLAGLRGHFGSGQPELQARATSVKQLLEWLIGESDDPVVARRAFFATEASEALTRDLRVLVNGRSVAFLAGLETKLEDGDAVTLHVTGARGYPGG